MLAYAREHGYTFTSRAYQNLAHLDIYAASRDIKDLVRRGMVRLSHKGGRVYEVVTVPAQPAEKPSEYIALEPVLTAKGRITNQDIREALGVSLHQAGRIARQLVALGWLRPQGERRGRYYVSAQ